MAFFGCVNLQLFGAKQMKITTTPSDAKIYVDGSEVGQGTYTVKFGKNDDFFIVKVTAQGYIYKEMKLLKTDPRKSVAYTLQRDEAYAATIGEDEAALISNKWIDVTVRNGLNEDQAWKRLVSAVQKSFNDIETRDKASGYLKTQWVSQNFGGVTVRTQLEIRANFAQDGLGYQVKLTSEVKYNVYNENGFRKYDRVLKKYEHTITDIQSSVGGGE